MTRVRIPTPLRSYTNGETWATASGTTIDEALMNLDHQFPGIRFRVIDEQNTLRQHMKIYLNNNPITDLQTLIEAADELTLMQALSGG